MTWALVGLFSHRKKLRNKKKLKTINETDCTGSMGIKQQELEIKIKKQRMSKDVGAENGP